MAKKSKTDGEELSLIAKAIRRGEKLERTLTKLTRLNEPQSHVETFLKAVQKGLEQLRQEPAATETQSKAPKKKAKAVQKQKIDESAVAPAAVKRTRKPKAPDLVAPADAKAT
ncbi:hypothetical protein AB4Y85_00120 [Microvirga sp. 2YAF29]|uniref:hypothetical protein n=1 Tax=Microvirga sp. 2YAF29 TaxID=3233031 RepID=UPI003F963201